MKGDDIILNKKRYAIIIFLLVIILLPTTGHCNTHERIYVNLPAFTLSYTDRESNLHHYPVAIGSVRTQTPEGNYRLIKKTVNPTWRPADKPSVPPGPNNPLGTRWMGFFRGYGIHGNNNATSIGTYVSAGCIRMYDHHAEELYSMVRMNTPVIIDYNTILPKQDQYSGRWLVEVYKDVYNKGTNNIDTVKKTVDKYLPYVEGNVFNERLRSIDKSNIVFAQGTVVNFNNKTLTDDCFMQEEILWINKETISHALALDGYFKQGKTESGEDFLRTQGQDIQILKENNRTYIALQDVVRLFNIKMEYKENIDTVYLTHVHSTLNGYYLTSNVTSVFSPGEIQYNAPRPRIAIRDFAEALGMNVQWQQDDNNAIINGVAIDGSLVNSRLYATLDELQKKLSVDYLWEPTLGRIRMFYDKKMVIINGNNKPMRYKEIDGFLLVPYEDALKYLTEINGLGESFRLNLQGKEYIFLQLVENLHFDYNKFTGSLIINYPM